MIYIVYLVWQTKFSSKQRTKKVFGPQNVLKICEFLDYKNWTPVYAGYEMGGGGLDLIWQMDHLMKRHRSVSTKFKKLSSKKILSFFIQKAYLFFPLGVKLDRLIFTQFWLSLYLPPCFSPNEGFQPWNVLCRPVAEKLIRDSEQHTISPASTFGKSQTGNLWLF